MISDAYVPPGSLVPLFRPPPAPFAPILGRLTVWNPTTRENTVVLRDGGGFGQGEIVNVPVLSSAEATLAVEVTVLLLPYGPGYIIMGRIRTP